MKTANYENLKFLMKHKRIILQALSLQKQNDEGPIYFGYPNDSVPKNLKEFYLRFAFHCNR